jgi:hypothetical protein
VVSKEADPVEQFVAAMANLHGFCFRKCEEYEFVDMP